MELEFVNSRDAVPRIVVSACLLVPEEGRAVVFSERTSIEGQCRVPVVSVELQWIFNGLPLLVLPSWAVKLWE